MKHSIFQDFVMAPTIYSFREKAGAFLAKCLKRMPLDCPGRPWPGCRALQDHSFNAARANSMRPMRRQGHSRGHMTHSQALRDGQTLQDSGAGLEFASHIGLLLGLFQPSVSSRVLFLRFNLHRHGVFP